MKNELTFKNHNKGFAVAKALLDEDYVVLLSYEEELLILNYEYSFHGADRNDVIFMQRDEFEEENDVYLSDILDDIAGDIKAGRSIESILGDRLK